MKIDLSIEVSGAPEDLQTLLEQVGEACCQVEGITHMQAGGRLVNDETIRTINREFRGIDRSTDVLSFPSVTYAAGRTARTSPNRLRREFDPETGCTYLGDFALSLDHAKAQAAQYGHSLARELGYLTAHSMFHLMGYDHEDPAEKKKMRELEEKAMAMVHLSRDDDSAVSDEALFHEALAMLEKAYVPYSDFRVGACILGKSRRTYTGCNIENASYGATICAERCAVGNAVSQGETAFEAIAVVGTDSDAWPCGICRQVLNEFGRGMKVICGNAKSGTYTVTTLDKLLPYSFGPEYLSDK